MSALPVSPLDELVRILVALDSDQLDHWYGPDADPSEVAAALAARLRAVAPQAEDGDKQPAIGDQVVVLYGAPYEMTWDDSGAGDIDVEGVLTEVLGPEWLAPFVVRTADGRTVYASKIRASRPATRGAR